MPPKEILVKKPASWNTSDDAKLLTLFTKGPHKGGVDANKTDAKYIRNQVLTFHFPERKDDFKNFAPLYRRKASKFQLHGALTGARGTSFAVLLSL